MLLDQVEFLEGQIGRLGARIGEVLPAPFEEAIERLVTIPGIERRAAENIVAELGAEHRVHEEPLDQLVLAISG